ncbi:MYND-type zinc finger protein samB [Parastagonospora nodorum]|nr:MYND-type zinc finger protein samB [Parastagonospora nodorum]
MTSSESQDFGQPLVLEDYMPVAQPVAPDAHGLCAICHKATELQRCAGCHNILYCSKKCQKADRKEHKSLCREFTTSAKIRPTTNSRRALLLAPEYPRARFHWVLHDNDGRPDVQSCYHDTQPGDIKTIGFHDRYLPYWLQISYDSNPKQRRNLGANSVAQHAINGNVVVVAYDAVEGLSAPPLDVDTKTLRAVLDYLWLRSSYDGPIFIEQPQERYTVEQWEEIQEKAQIRGPAA